MSLIRTQKAEWQDRAIEITCAAVTSPQTQRLYRGAIQRFLDWVVPGEHPSAAAAVDAYKQHLRKTISARSVNTYLAALTKFFEISAREGFVKEEVYESVRKVDRLEVRGTKTGIWLRVDDLLRLREAPDESTPIGLRDKLVLYLLTGCGLRRAELASLTWGHIVKQQDSWQLKNILGKGQKLRTIGIAPDVMTFLEKFERQADEDLILYSFDNKGNRYKGLSAEAIKNIVAKYAKRCGFGDVRPHDLRRSIAQYLYENTDIVTVQQFLGHASTAQTEKYLAGIVDLKQMSHQLVLKKDKGVQIYNGF